jgi:hypothetical protein
VVTNRVTEPVNKHTVGIHAARACARDREARLRVHVLDDDHGGGKVRQRICGWHGARRAGRCGPAYRV